MGVFFEQAEAVTAPPVQHALHAAYLTGALSDPEALDRARVHAQQVSPHSVPLKFQPARFVAALLILAVLVGVGIWAESQGWKTSSKEVFGLAATLFGVVVGLLGGEKPS